MQWISYFVVRRCLITDNISLFYVAVVMLRLVRSVAYYGWYAFAHVSCPCARAFFSFVSLFPFSSLCVFLSAPCTCVIVSSLISYDSIERLLINCSQTEHDIPVFSRSQCFSAGSHWVEIAWILTHTLTHTPGLIGCQKAIEWMNEWIYLLDKIKVSQAGTPRHDNCVRLPVSWKPMNN